MKPELPTGDSKLWPLVPKLKSLNPDCPMSSMLRFSAELAFHVHRVMSERPNVPLPLVAPVMVSEKPRTPAVAVGSSK